jgi:hypothetical protein
VKRFRDRPGDAALVGDPEDCRPFPLQQFHGSPNSHFGFLILDFRLLKQIGDAGTGNVSTAHLVP